MVFIFLTGAVATAITDLWTLAPPAGVRTPLPNYGSRRPLDRAHGARPLPTLHRGRRRRSARERAIGWIAHYLIGIAFAFLLPAFWGREWILHPTLAAGANRRHRHGGGAFLRHAARDGRRCRREPHATP